MMLSNEYKTYFKWIFITHFFLILGVLLWINPSPHVWLKNLDTQIFTFLNEWMMRSTRLQALMGVLNNRVETKLNLLFAIALNILAIIASRNKTFFKIRAIEFIYFWACFQIGYFLQDWFFNAWLHLERLSPSLLIDSSIKLSEVLSDSNIKDSSPHSFPSGHAFSMIFWASFTYLCAPRYIGIFALVSGFLLSAPRLFVGAHWASDVLFSMILALCWLSLTLVPPIRELTNFQMKR